MKCIDDKHIMMIEPTGERTSEPVLDDVTRKMAGALATARHSNLAFRGVHVCACGALSDNREWFVVSADGERKTNSLAVHYLAYHRAEVPSVEIDKVRALSVDERHPTKEQLR